MLLGAVWLVTGLHDARPPSQQAFEEAVAAAARRYDDAPPLRKPEAYAALVAATNEAAAAAGRLDRWRGVVDSVGGSAERGQVSLSVLSKTAGYSIVYHLRLGGADLAKAAGGLDVREGQSVEVSGGLARGADGAVQELSLTEAGRALSPEFRVEAAEVGPSR